MAMVLMCTCGAALDHLLIALIGVQIARFVAVVFGFGRFVQFKDRRLP